MALYEKADCMVSVAVRDFLESQGLTSKTSQKDAVITYSHVEMGRDHHRLHSKVAKDNTWN